MTCHLARLTHAGRRAEQLGGTAANSERSGSTAAGDGPNANTVREPNLCQKEADANSGGSFERRRNDLDQPLPHACQGKHDKNDALDEDRSQSRFVRDLATSIHSNDLEKCSSYEKSALFRNKHFVLPGTRNKR